MTASLGGKGFARDELAEGFGDREREGERVSDWDIDTGDGRLRG